MSLVARRSRGKPDAPARPAGPKRHDESVTARLDMTPEALASMFVDESDRPTVRMPVRPPFATREDEALARDQKVSDVTIRKRVVIGPDGQPQMIDADELEETTSIGPPPSALLSRARAPKKKAKR